MNNRHGDPETVEGALDKTLKDLGIEYLDLYLMHWPVGSAGGENKLDYVSVCLRLLDSSPSIFGGNTYTSRHGNL